ncbi:unnamed protein product [Haemonchus placei]|uniref:Calmodulin n=1 Tax=Haemonchus placei TaxID=6290 RepID=A0A0N4WCH7_HAEPC|nr:unnamed protein product [Haemonchus placei]
MFRNMQIIKLSNRLITQSVQLLIIWSWSGIEGSTAFANKGLKTGYLQVDVDGNGEIDFEEFCACMKKSRNIVRSTKEELIRECFDIFDQDHNGMISESEFKYVAREYGDFSEELAEKVFREMDVSSIGHLSADQFATVIEDYLVYDSARIDIGIESECH